MARNRREFKKRLSANLVIGNEHCLRVSRQKMNAVRRQRILADAPADLDDEPPPDEPPLGGDSTTILHNGGNPPPLPPETGREAAGEQGGILATTILHNGGSDPPPDEPPLGGDSTTILHNRGNPHPLPPEGGREAAGEQGGSLATTILHNGGTPQHPPLNSPDGAVVGGVGCGDPPENGREAVEVGDHNKGVSNESPTREYPESTFTLSDMVVATVSLPEEDSAPRSLTSGQGGDNAENN